ncbi:MAG: RNA polymerase sigma factor [Planctomycetota bacterium]|jgi:RNA polymerase sigma-70 factor (ECF subfamily)
MLNIETSRYTNEVSPHEAHDRVEKTTQIFQKYSDEIYRIILFHIKDRSEADDIFQDLFLSFVRNPVPSDTKNIMAYIYKTITNDIFDLVRKKRNYQYRVARYAEQRKYLIKTLGPEERAIRAEEFQKLFSLIKKRLPSRQAQAIHLRYINNYTTSEAAKKMGVDEKTVSRYLWAGLRRAQKLFSQTEFEPNVC